MGKTRNLFFGDRGTEYGRSRYHALQRQIMQRASNVPEILPKSPSILRKTVTFMQNPETFYENRKVPQRT